LARAPCWDGTLARRPPSLAVDPRLPARRARAVPRQRPPPDRRRDRARLPISRGLGVRARLEGHAGGGTALVRRASRVAKPRDRAWDHRGAGRGQPGLRLPPVAAVDRAGPPRLVRDAAEPAAARDPPPAETARRGRARDLGRAHEPKVDRPRRRGAGDAGAVDLGVL